MTPEKIGSYPIEREVGRGGMGVVYLGRDTRLDRPVAIKVLPDAFARDPERLARFEREARLLAALTHPNIAGIYGLEEADGRRFLALEYVEGETLAERLRRGPLSVEDTLDVGRQIASALEAAHEAGIVHRDLKPGNVKLTPAGEVKVLDFGLAKSAAGAESSLDLSQSPTVAFSATGAGVILGTAAYMSPEQARGKPVDRRTDIWSFGCVLYECLTGTQAFAGETVSDTIALILQGSADWSKLPAETPEKLRMLLTRCFERDARGRLRDIGDARIEIEDLMGSRVSSHSRVAVDPPTRVYLANDPNELSISPDGQTLAFVANDSTGQATLWVRPLGDFEARELPGTKNATLPFWSPDGKQIGFFADGKLKRTRAAGGQPEPICDASSGRGASWNRNDVIVFSPSPTGPLYQVRARGGSPEAVTAVDSTRAETAHRWPCFLPDGEHFTYAALPVKNGQFTCYVGSLCSKQRTPLLTAIGAPVYAAPGYLIFSRNDALLAQRFDLGRRQVTGDPFSIGEPPARSGYSGAPGASVSANGVLAWQSAGKQNTRLVWLDRGGRETGAVDLPADRWGLFNLSPDGRYACINRGEGSGTLDLWIVDLARGVANRLTMGTGTNYIGAWSPHGKWVVMGELGGENGWNLFVMPAAGGARTPFLVTPFNEQYASISPDGRWVLYTSDETGSTQAFVQSFPTPGMKQQVSKTRAVIGVWAGSGREIFLLRADFSVISVPVTPGTELQFGPPQEMYRLPLNSGGWWPAPNGQRFLATIPAERTVPGISVAVNWRAGREE